MLLWQPCSPSFESESKVGPTFFSLSRTPVVADAYGLDILGAKDTVGDHVRDAVSNADSWIET